MKKYKLKDLVDNGTHARKKIDSDVIIGDSNYGYGPGDILDANAVNQLVIDSVSTNILGVTTTELTDGSTSATISIDGQDVSVKKGDMTFSGNKEFIFNGTIWQEFGDLSALGTLAYKDAVSVSVTSAGSNESSTVTFESDAGSDFVTGYNNDAVAPSFTEGAFTPASIGTGFYSAGTAPSFTEGTFSQGTLPSLGEATTGSFTTEGVVASIGTGNDAETLILTAASTSSAVTAQGTFSAGTLPTKSADTFSAGTMASIDVTKFNGGSKAPDTFSAGSAATLAKAKALTASNTGTAAAQTFTGSAASVTVSYTDHSA